MRHRSLLILAGIAVVITAVMAWQVHVSPVRGDGLPDAVLISCRASAARQLHPGAPVRYSDEISYSTPDSYWHVIGTVTDSVLTAQYRCDAEPYQGRWIIDTTLTRKDQS